MKKFSALILACSILVVSLSACGSPKRKSHDIEDYETMVISFEYLDSDLHSKYGMYVEDAIRIVEAMICPEDYGPISDRDKSTAYDVLKAYYNESRKIVLSLAK